jgi:predicted adenylyl cyclase CyaB
MEIEVKVKYKNRDDLVNWLKSHGYFLEKTKEINDSYYSCTGSMSNKNSLYRLRNVVGEFRELTLKDSIKDNKGVWSRREINISINDPEGMADILSSLGCKLIKENFSKREIWNKGNLEFAFIDFSKPAVLNIAEIEGPDEKSVQKEIRSLGNKIEVAGEDVFSVFDKKS